MATKGYLGIDAGTQGLSILFADESLNVLATGEADYAMVPNLADGCYEQSPEDWIKALSQASVEARKQLANQDPDFEVLGVGISGQMHGEVQVDATGKSLGPARLWCDSRNEAEGNELTERFGKKMPKRITAARWLWTIRNQPERAAKTARLTTPAGWIAHRLTGQWNLGIGDASGMFPIDQTTLDYDQRLLDSFDQLVGSGLNSLRDLLPTVRCAGQDGGTLSEDAARGLGLPAGIPVAPAEGDQPAALAGSLIAEAGTVSVSFGTSVCANSVGDRPFDGVSSAVDHFCAPDGKPINMVWLRNGTTFMNTVVEMFGLVNGGDRSSGFAAVMPQLVSANPDCDGLFALPFMDDEPGLGVEQGGTATIVGLSPENATPGNVAKAALLATMFNLKFGSQVLDRQGFPRTKLVLSGGLTKTPATAQILADVFNTPVTLLESAEEGTAWGAALMAKYRYEIIHGLDRSWAEFLANQASSRQQQFEPIGRNVNQYDKMYQRYTRLLSVQPKLAKSLE